MMSLTLEKLVSRMHLYFLFASAEIWPVIVTENYGILQVVHTCRTQLN